MTIVDAHELYARLVDQGDQDGDCVVMGNDLYEVEMRYDKFDQLEKMIYGECRSLEDFLGCSYTFTLADAVDHLDEFVVSVSMLQHELFDRMGFHLVSWFSFKSYIDRHCLFLVFFFSSFFFTV